MKANSIMKKHRGKMILLLVVAVFVGTIICGLRTAEKEQKASEQTRIVEQERQAKLDSIFTENEKAIIEDNIMQNLYSYTDEFENIKWTHSKGSVNTKNAFSFYGYIGEKGDTNTLRLVTGFHRDDWIFTKEIKILADGEVYEIPFYNLDTKVERGIYEWIDISIDNEMLMSIESIIVAENAKIRFSGKNEHKEYVIDVIQKNQLIDIVNYYYLINENYKEIDSKAYLYSEYEEEYEKIKGFWEAIKVKTRFDDDDNYLKENQCLVRAYNTDRSMIEIENQRYSEHINEYSYRIFNESFIQNIYGNYGGYYGYEKEKIQIVDGDLVVQKFKDNFKHIESDRYTMKRITEERFRKLLEEVDD